MCEELDALIGVDWGECSPKRKEYRNGSYSRDFTTYGSFYGSKLLALHHLDDPHLWVVHNRSLDATPHLAHCRK
jgi:Transposase, Mutator family